MSSVDTPSPKSRGESKLPHRRSRPPIRIDMTPMVDVAFLLLIFFMVTTVFRQPQAMEMVLPKDNSPVPVPISNVVTLYAERSGEIRWRAADGPIQAARVEDVHQLLGPRFNVNRDLVVLAKIDRSAPYRVMVDILDEIESAGVPRFSVVSMNQEDRRLLAGERPAAGW